MVKENLIQEAIQLIQAGEECGTPLRLLGGLAVRMTSPSSENAPLQRSYADIDFVGLERDGRKIKGVFLALGYMPDERFNALHGRTRLIFYNQDTQKHVDIFLDRFEMCHTLDLRKRLLPGYRTLPMVDLLVTKLQIVQLNAKDSIDILTLLLDHDTGLGEASGKIDIAYLAELVRSDWGLFTTLYDNLEKTHKVIQDFLFTEAGELVSSRIEVIQEAMEKVPKTIRWKLRSKIGRRMEWYELPDEVNR